MKKITVGGIIHIFAFLHAAVSLSCRLMGADDELLLTILTMTMVLFICIKKGLNIEFTAASIIAANILGYIIGNAVASGLSNIIAAASFTHAIATALTSRRMASRKRAVLSVLAGCLVSALRRRPASATA